MIEQAVLRIVNADQPKEEISFLDQLRLARGKIENTKAGVSELLKGSTETLRKTQECLDALYKV